MTVVQVAQAKIASIANEDGTFLASGLLIAGERPFIVASTRQLDVSHPERKSHSLRVGSQFNVSGPDATSVATVVRSAFDLKLTTLQLAKSVGEGVVLRDHLGSGDAYAWDGEALIDLSVRRVEGRIGRLEVRRQTTVHDPDAVAGRLVGHPIWAPDGTFMGMITTYTKGGRYYAWRADQVRRELPVEPGNVGSHAHVVRALVEKPLLSLHGSLRPFNRRPLPQDLAAMVRTAHEQVTAFFAAQSDTFGTWLVDRATTLQSAVTEWTTAREDPRGDGRREEIWSHLTQHRLRIFGEIYHLSPSELQAMVARAPQASAAINSTILLLDREP